MSFLYICIKAGFITLHKTGYNLINHEKSIIGIIGGVVWNIQPDWG